MDSVTEFNPVTRFTHRSMSDETK